jgi:hypothetical protein
VSPNTTGKLVFAGSSKYMTKGKKKKTLGYTMRMPRLANICEKIVTALVSMLC